MKLTAYIDRANRWFFRLTDADGEVVADNASPIDDKTAFDVTADALEASTPTLAEVLTAGNEPGVVQAIGPFAIAFDDEGITDDDNNPYGAFVGPVLPPGTVVLGTRLLVTETFDGTQGDPGGTVNVETVDGDSGVAVATTLASSSLVAVANGFAAGTVDFGAVIPDDSNDWRLLVWLNLDGTESQGAADLYALVQYPAA